MPINLKEIVVDFKEYDLDDDEQVFCSLCKQLIVLCRANDWEPKEHTLDQCLAFLIAVPSIKDK